MKLSLCVSLLAALLCPGASSAAPGGSHTHAPPVPGRTKALVQTLKRIADAVRDKNATVGSISMLIGPLKQHWGDYDELTPTNPDFSEGSVSVALYHKASRLLLRERKPDDLDLTLARGVVLAPDALKGVFGRWRTVVPPPEGNPYHIVYYYPNANAKLSIVVLAELTGPAHVKGSRILSITLQRQDLDEAMREAR